MFEAGVIDKHFDKYKLFLRIIRFSNKEVWTPNQLEKWQPIKFDGFTTVLLYLGYLYSLTTCVILIESIYFLS